MEEDTQDAAVKAHNLSAGPSKTVGRMLEGAKDWTPPMCIRLVQDYGLEVEVGTTTSCKILLTFPTFPGFSEILAGRFPKSGRNKQKVRNPPPRVSGKPGYLKKVTNHFR